MSTLVHCVPVKNRLSNIIKNVSIDKTDFLYSNLLQFLHTFWLSNKSGDWNPHNFKMECSIKKNMLWNFSSFLKKNLNIYLINIIMMEGFLTINKEEKPDGNNSSYYFVWFANDCCIISPWFNAPINKLLKFVC